MKTREQVHAMFVGMQRDLFANKNYQSVDIRTYNNENGDYWAVEILVCVFEKEMVKPTLFESVEWVHYPMQDESDERKNITILEEFKSKFNLK